MVEFMNHRTPFLRRVYLSYNFIYFSLYVFGF